MNSIFELIYDHDLSHDPNGPEKREIERVLELGRAHRP